MAVSSLFFITNFPLLIASYMALRDKQLYCGPSILEAGKKLSKYSCGVQLNGLFSKVSLRDVPSVIRHSIHLTDGMNVKQRISE
jgi:hypothetical protein